MARKTRGKGSALSLYEKVYRELAKTYIGAERQRNVPGTHKDRYDDFTEMGADIAGGNNIVVWGSTRERLNFATRVADYYHTTYEIIEEPWRRDPDRRYKIKIAVGEY